MLVYTYTHIWILVACAKSMVYMVYLSAEQVPKSFATHTPLVQRKTAHHPCLVCAPICSHGSPRLVAPTTHDHTRKSSCSNHRHHSRSCISHSSSPPQALPPPLPRRRSPAALSATQLPVPLQTWRRWGVWRWRWRVQVRLRSVE